MAQRTPSTIKAKIEAGDFKTFPELASDKAGGSIVFATDEWFAAAPNIISSAPPVWKEGVFSEQGKWMDGWESRRKRIPGHDWAIIKLGIPGDIKGFVVDTSFFTGNNPPAVSIQAASLGPNEEAALAATGDEAFVSRVGTAATAAMFRGVAKLDSDKWTTLVPKTKTNPGYIDCCHHEFAISGSPPAPWTHVRLNLYPDGGVARLRVYGEVKRSWDVARESKVDLVAVENGGRALIWSNSHYGTPSLMLTPGRGVDMGDGWETARNPDRPPVLEAGPDGIIRGLRSEWAVFQLGCPGKISEIECDTAHFKGNFPESFKIEGTDRLDVGDDGVDRSVWISVLKRSKLQADEIKIFPVPESKLISHLRLTMYPDGGISRIRVRGTPVPSAKI